MFPLCYSSIKVTKEAFMSITKKSGLDYSNLSSMEIRKHIRDGQYDGCTSGLASGKLQCNLVILPEIYALDFVRFCQRNPKPCPIVGISETGDPMLPTLGKDIDIRTDVPRYRVFRNGEFLQEITDISDLWSDDFVTVALGCSFTFENALLQANIPVRHIEMHRNVPMYRTNINLISAGPFNGEMVVSMRPFPEDKIKDVVNISKQYPYAHGKPIAIGDPTAIGISDLNHPDYGDAVPINKGEIPVYWACGVTPQNVFRRMQLPFCITHAPGHMLITDVAEDAETTIY